MMLNRNHYTANEDVEEHAQEDEHKKLRWSR